jgi:hypothetical protein
VIASKDAFFLVRLNKIKSRGQVYAEILSDTVQAAVGKDQIEIPIAELPQTILDHKDWPLWDHDGTVRVVPKSAIQSLSFPWWGALKLKTATRSFRIGVPWWKTISTRRRLRELGWKL